MVRNRSELWLSKIWVIKVAYPPNRRKAECCSTCKNWYCNQHDEGCFKFTGPVYSSDTCDAWVKK